MSYIVKTSFYEGNTLHEEGTTFDHEDKTYIEKCLADGNIAEVTEGGSESITPLETEQPGSGSELSPETPTVSPETPQAPETPEQPSVTESQPVQPVAGQPTPSEIEETLESTGLTSGDSSSSTPIDVQIS